MNNLIALGVKNENNKIVVSSRIVAENFEKRHDNVLRDIEDIIEGDLLKIEEIKTEQYFISSTYQDPRNREYPEYLLTRDGFTLLTMGYTGEKAMRFKVAYINEFNRMEAALKPKSQLDILRAAIDQIELAQKEAKEAKQIATTAKNTIENIKDTIIQTDEDWRKWVNSQISRMAFHNKDYREKRNESYQLLEERARCRLSIRLDNLKERLAAAGVKKTEINGANYMDVIESDVRLKEIYTAIVKEMAIKYVA
ncbi:MAG: Rha family transcriptional regulator [Clostridiales bacterium]|nr:Rha family transcriptional regulator [Clostridiales bacterium]